MSSGLKWSDYYNNECNIIWIEKYGDKYIFVIYI